MPDKPTAFPPEPPKTGVDWMDGDTPGAPAPDVEAVTPTDEVLAARWDKLIYSKIIAVMREVTAVGKEGWNEQQKYKFRGIDAAVNALGPAMRKHGLFAVPKVLDMNYRDTLTTQDKKTREVTAQVEYTFFAEDGSSITAVVNGESLDTSDKGTAKAMSVAFRIVLLQVFALPTDEPTTDDTGQYHTRSGRAEGMSKFERATGLALLTVPTPEQREQAGSSLMIAAFRQAVDFKECLDEHGALDQPVGRADGITWGELFTARMADEIAAADTTDDVMAAWGTMRGTGALELMHGDKAVGILVKERAAVIKERNANAFDTIMRQVQGAETVEDIDGPVKESINNACASQRITDEQRDQLTVVANERADKLERQLNETAHGSSFNAPQGEQAAYEVGM